MNEKTYRKRSTEHICNTDNIDQEYENSGNGYQTFVLLLMPMHISCSLSSRLLIPFAYYLYLPKNEKSGEGDQN